MENYRQEAQAAESLRRKFQEIARRTGPTGDPNCPPYVIKAKYINRQLVQMIDASSGGSEAKRSVDGLNDASDSEDEGSASNMMGMMMVQQRSEQSSREAELALWREEMAMRRDEMTSQLQIQHEESCAQQQMMIRNFFRYLECCFATGESSVTVILKSMNLNIHMDGIIQWGASLGALLDEHCIFY